MYVYVVWSCSVQILTSFFELRLENFWDQILYISFPGCLCMCVCVLVQDSGKGKNKKSKGHHGKGKPKTSLEHCFDLLARPEKPGADAMAEDADMLVHVHTHTHIH